MVTLTTSLSVVVVAHLRPSWLDVVAFAPYWVHLSLGIMLFVIIVCLGPSRALSIGGARHPVSHPPIWLAIVVGTSLALWLLSRNVGIVSEGLTIESGASSNLNLAAWGTALPGLIPFLLHPLTRLSRQHTPPLITTWTTTSQITDITSTAVLEWSRTDDPISQPTEDLFQHRAIARRMALRFRTDQQIPAQAIVGRLGTGKTSLLRLVRAYLETHGPTNIEIINVELWPYENARAAVEGVLRTLTSALAFESGSSQLDGLPAAYGRAIASGAGIDKWLPVLPLKSPAELIQSLDDKATLIGKRYVLWIEDLERFTAGPPDAPLEHAELERLGPIRAVLFALSTRRSLSVITATTDLFRRFDTEKIAQYVERIPEIPPRTVRRMLSQIRMEWLRDSTLLFIAWEQKTGLGWDDDVSADDYPDRDRLAAALLGNEITSFALAVSTLASTPRILKQGLRRAFEGWDRLAGEIDVDDLIGLSMLKEAAPNAYALIDRSIGPLRDGPPRVEKQAKSTPLEELRARLDDLELEPTLKVAITVLVNYIFGEGRNRYQSVAQFGHADYWHRLQTVPVIADDERDQSVLREMKTKDFQALVTRLLSSRYSSSSAVEDLSAALTVADISQLLAILVKRLVDKPQSSWPETHAPGLVPLWRIARKHIGHEDLGQLASEVERSLEMAAESNLALLHELTYWFATSSREIEDLFSDTVHGHIKARALELFIAAYTHAPNKLADSLRGASPFTLLWISYGMERIRGNKRDRPFSQWSEISSTLLLALDARPEVMAPQVAAFVVRTKDRFRDERWVFDPELCQLLFGDPAAFQERFKRATDHVTDRSPMVDAVCEVPEQREPAEDATANDDGEVENIAAAVIARRVVWSEAKTSTKLARKAIVPGEASELNTSIVELDGARDVIVRKLRWTWVGMLLTAVTSAAIGVAQLVPTVIGKVTLTLVAALTTLVAGFLTLRGAKSNSRRLAEVEVLRARILKAMKRGDERPQAPGTSP